jgi:hypothetical protein
MRIWQPIPLFVVLVELDEYERIVAALEAAILDRRKLDADPWRLAVHETD